MIRTKKQRNIITKWSLVSDLEIVGLDVRPDTHETTQTRNLRLTKEVTQSRWKVHEVNQIPKLLGIISYRLLQPLRLHLDSKQQKFYANTQPTLEIQLLIPLWGILSST